MRLTRMLRHRARAIIRPGAAGGELERELSLHLEQLARENLEAGMSPEEARLAARRAMGNLAVIEERCRDHQRVGWLRDLGKDLAYAWRLCAKSPGFTAVAALALALGAGAGIAVFTLADALLLRSLPYPHPERLVSLTSVHARRGDSGCGQEDFRDWQASNTVFERMAFAEFDQVTLASGGDPERVTGLAVSPGFFEMLGVQPQLGRWWTPAEQRPGADRVVLLSHRLWVRRFGGRPDVVRAAVTLTDRSYRITGVMPPSFRFNEGDVAEYWTPISYFNRGRMQHQYSAYARLKPGVTLRAAQYQMTGIARRLARAYPGTNRDWTVHVDSLRGELLREIGPALAIFAAAVAIVLAIACGNVASLLLARATGRAKEIAVRLALGASRARIIRLMLAESLLLAALGTAAGIGLAYALVQAAIAASPPWLELRSAIAISSPLVAFTLAMALLTGVLTGVWPAIRGSRGDLNRDLKESGASVVASRSQERPLSALVIAEMALAVVLTTFAGLFIRSVSNLLHTDLGFRSDHLLTFRVSLPRSRYADDDARLRFFNALLADLARVPGVLSAAAADAIPMGGAYSSTSAEIEGRPDTRDWADRSTGNRSVSPDYFRAMSIPLRRGRTFGAADRNDTEPVAIVNDAFVRKFLPDEEPVGKRFRSGNRAWRRIVGVVGDLRHSGPTAAPLAETYAPLAQEPWAQFVVIRTAAPPESLISPVRGVIRALDRGLPLTQVRSMDQALAGETALPRQLRAVVTGFAAVAVALAMIGLAGVMAYHVSRRRREIGLRIALGASRGDVVREFARGAAWLLALGLTAGLAAALATTRLLQSALFGVKPNDPAVLAAAALLLAAVGLAACIAPGYRAALLNPIDTLRQE